MSYRTPHEQSLDYWIETLQFFADECRNMESANLRLGGKIFATACIAGLTVLGHASGDIAVGSIAAIWVVTIPSLVEAWIIAKDRQQARMRNPDSDD